MNREGKCAVAGAHSESDSATDAGTNRCPQGVPKMSQIRSVGSGNVLHNANTDLFEVDAIVSFKASFGLQCSTPRDKNCHILTFCGLSHAMSYAHIKHITMILNLCRLISLPSHDVT